MARSFGASVAGILWRCLALLVVAAALPSAALAQNPPCFEPGTITLSNTDLNDNGNSFNLLWDTDKDGTGTAIAGCDTEDEGLFTADNSNTTGWWRADFSTTAANSAHGIIYHFHWIEHNDATDQEVYVVSLASTTNFTSDVLTLYFTSSAQFMSDTAVQLNINILPTVTGVSPAAGSSAGGTSIVVTGSGFSGAEAVQFGTASVLAANFIAQSDTSITVPSPAGTAGPVDVRVTGPSGTSAVNQPGDIYTYIDPPLATASSTMVAYDSVDTPATLNLTGGTPTTFTITPNGLHGVAAQSGSTIVYTPVTGFFGTDSFTYTAGNGGGTSSAATVSVAVSPPSISVTPTTLTTDEATVPYSTSLTANGGVSPYSFDTIVASGALPPGLTLAANGTLSGTPTAAGSYTFTVSGTDSSTSNSVGTHAGFTSSTISLTIQAAPTATVQIGTTGLVVNTPATPFTPVTGSGGTGTLTYGVAPGLPTGLSFDTANGQITGTPMASSAANSYKVTVTDRNGGTATANFTLGIRGATPTVGVTASLNPASFGEALTLTASVGGAIGTPTGTVTFKDGAATLFTGTLANRLTSYTTSVLTVGSHAITVSYGGDSHFAPGSAGLIETVEPATCCTGGPAYSYSRTLGMPGVPGAVDTVDNHVFIADPANDRVQVLDGQSLAVVATIGTSGVGGTDDTHLNQPGGVGFDAVTGRVFVADTGNDRIQVFDAKSFTYLATIGAVGVTGTDTGHFNLPQSVHLNGRTHQLYIADTGNQRVQIFDAGALSYIATLGTAGVAGNDDAHFSLPYDAELNPGTNQIMVADSGNQRVQLFDAGSLAYGGTLSGTSPGDPDYVAQPVTASFDPTSNLVLIADRGLDDRVQVLDAMSYAPVLTLGTTGSSGTGNSQFAGPSGVAADPLHARLYVGDSGNDRVQVYAIASTPIVASVLPGSRSMQLGKPATIFATVINSGTTVLDDCRVALPVTAPDGLTLDYQTTNPASNQPIGTIDAPATIQPNDGLQTFLLTFNSQSAFSAPGQAIDFDCHGIGPASVVTGIDTADLSASPTPVPDIIALAATVSNDGIVSVPVGGAGAFAVASDNVGAAAPIIVSVDTGSATLPLTATLCQSNPSTGACLATPGGSVTLNDAAGATPTFSIFLRASAAIRLDPAASRLFVRFKDAAGNFHGSTSVAVQTD